MAQSHFHYVMQQRMFHHDYKTEVKALTNRQLLRQEREERREIADIAECEQRQTGDRKYYLGNDLPTAKKYAIKNHAVTVLEIEARGYVWKDDKYIQRKVKQTCTHSF